MGNHKLYNKTKNKDWVGVLTTYFRTKPDPNNTETPIEPVTHDKISKDYGTPKIKNIPHSSKHGVRTSSFNKKGFKEIELLTSQNLGDLTEPNDDIGLEEKYFAESKLKPDKIFERNLYSRLLIELLNPEIKTDDMMIKCAECIGAELVNLLDRRHAMAEEMGDNRLARTIKPFSQQVKNELKHVDHSSPMHLLEECLNILTPTLKMNYCSKSLVRKLLKQVVVHLSNAFENSNFSTDIATLSVSCTRKNNNKFKRKYYTTKTHSAYLSSKDLFLEETMSFYNKALVLCKQKVTYHRQVEVLARTKIPKIENRLKRIRISSNLVNKRLLLNRQIMVLYQVARIVMVTNSL